MTWKWREAEDANRRYVRELDQKRWGLAQQHWQADDVFTARQLLLETSPERRGWEWYYHWNLTYQTPFNRLPQLDSHVLDMATSGDGKQLAIAQDNGTIQVWDLISGEVLHQFTPTPKCHKLALSGTANWLLGIHGEGWLLWDLHSGQLAREQATKSEPRDVAWHPDGERFYLSGRFGSPELGNHNWIHGHHVTANELLFEARQEPHWNPLLHVSTNGQRLYDLASRQFLDPRTGEILGELDLPDTGNPRFATDKEKARLIALADDERIALLQPDYVLGNQMLILQRVGQSRLIPIPLPSHDKTYFAFSPDGRQLAISIHERNFDWDDIAFQEQMPLIGPLANLLGRSRHWLSPVFLHDTASGRRLRTLRGFPSYSTKLVFHPDGDQLIVGGGEAAGDPQTTPGTWGDVVFWNVREAETSRVIAGHESEIRHLSIDASGEKIATAGKDGWVRIWDLSTGQPRWTSPVPPLNDASIWTTAHFAPDRDHLAVARGAMLQILDGTSAEILRTIPTTDEYHLTAVELGPAEKNLVYLSERGARVFDLQRNERVLEVPSAVERQTEHELPNRAKLSPDGQLLAVTYQFPTDGEIRLYDIASGKIRWRYRTESKPVGFTSGWGLINCSFSPDGRYLAAVGNNGPGLLFDVRRGRLVRQFDGHVNTVWGVAFSPDGRRLATGSYDHTVKLWDVATGLEIHTLRGHADAVHDVLFSPDGHRLVTASQNGQIRIWETLSPTVPTPSPSAKSGLVLRANTGR